MRLCYRNFNNSGIREPVRFSFNLDKPPGYKVFCKPETIQ